MDTEAAAPAAQPMRIAILVTNNPASGEAIARACAQGRLPGCEVALVISNVPGAAVIERARSLGLVAVALEARGREQSEHEEAISSLLRKFRIDLVCLTAYQRVLSPAFIKEWQGRLLNVHPSLLPAFSGLNPQQQALDSGVQFTGCTVHFIDDSADDGAVLVQHAIEIIDTDTLETLSDRILQEEQEAYIEALRRISSGHYELRNRRYIHKPQP